MINTTMKFRHKYNHEEVEVIDRAIHRGSPQLTLDDGTVIGEAQFFEEYEQVLPDFIDQSDAVHDIPPGVTQKGDPKKPIDQWTANDYMADFEMEMKQMSPNQYEDVVMNKPEPQPPKQPQITRESVTTNPVRALIGKAAKSEYIFEIPISTMMPKDAFLTMMGESFPEDVDEVCEVVFESIDMGLLADSIKSEIKKYVEETINSNK